MDRRLWRSTVSKKDVLAVGAHCDFLPRRGLVSWSRASRNLMVPDHGDVARCLSRRGDSTGEEVCCGRKERAGAPRRELAAAVNSVREL